MKRNDRYIFRRENLYTIIRLVDFDSESAEFYSSLDKMSFRKKEVESFHTNLNNRKIIVIVKSIETDSVVVNFVIDDEIKCHKLRRRDGKHGFSNRPVLLDQRETPHLPEEEERRAGSLD